MEQGLNTPEHTERPEHGLLWNEGKQVKAREPQRPYWECRCGRWVCYQTQRGKPEAAGAEKLLLRHIEEQEEPPELWW